MDWGKEKQNEFIRAWGGGTLSRERLSTLSFFRFSLQPSTKDGDITVTIVPGVTTGELSKFFKKNNVCLKSDVILDKVTYGGVIATGCHVR